jgi:8-oxo-dGTP pyrophosphatase MutT (NUDIX family)
MIEGKTKVIIKGFIESENKYLVLKRNSEAKIRPGKWDFVGGNVDQDDLLVEHSGKGDSQDILIKALVREIKEETSLELSNQSFEIRWVASGYDAIKQVFVMFLIYSTTVNNLNLLDLKLTEHQEADLISLEDLKSLDFGGELAEPIPSFIQTL